MKDFFPVSHIQLMSRCAVAGREHSQTASPSWPMEIFHTIEAMLSLWMGVGWGGGWWWWGVAGIFLSHFRGFNSSLVCEFELCWQFSLFGEFWEICEIHDFWVLWSLLRVRLWISHRVMRKTILHTVCSP